MLSGDLVGDPSRFGLDAAFPALFLALLAPQLREDGKAHAFGGLRLGGNRQVQAALLGAGIALVLTPFTPEGVPIVAASLACLLGLLPDPDAGRRPRELGRRGARCSRRSARSR